MIERVKNYRKKWCTHMERMKEERLLKIIVKYTLTNIKENKKNIEKKIVHTSRFNLASSTQDHDNEKLSRNSITSVKPLKEKIC